MQRDNLDNELILGEQKKLRINRIFYQISKSNKFNDFKRFLKDAIYKLMDEEAKLNPKSTHGVSYFKSEMDNYQNLDAVMEDLDKKIAKGEIKPEETAHFDFMLKGYKQVHSGLR